MCERFGLALNITVNAPTWICEIFMGVQGEKCYNFFTSADRFVNTDWIGIVSL